jgi:hypothetical protein
MEIPDQTEPPSQEPAMKHKILIAICMTVAAFACSRSEPTSAGNIPANSDQLSKSASALNWVEYTDSAEGAFSIDVPVGWQVQGGMYRFGYFDVRWMIDVRSLDGKIILRIDDANIPPYALPGPRTGRDGQPYFKPQQFQMIVSTYRDGQSYAEMYAKRRFASVCKTMTPRQPDWSPAMPSAWQIASGGQPTEGRISYDCATSDGPRIASVYARSTLYRSTGFWLADPVISIITTPSAASLAQSMVQRMIGSWRENPQWKQHQDRMTQVGLKQIRENFGQFMKQMQAYHQARAAAMNQQVAGFEARQNEQAQQVSSWGKTISGLQSVRDPQTGNQFQVFSGPKANYYMNGTGVKINSNISPGADFHQLTPVQP